MKLTKVFGFFAIALATAGATSAYAGCSGIADVYNKGGYSCKWLPNSYGQLSYACNGGGYSWLLLEGVRGGCEAVPSGQRTIGAVSPGAWVPVRVPPKAILLPR